MTEIHVIAPGISDASAPIELLGGKAFNLAVLARAGLPVPPAFVLPTTWCRRFRHGELPADELQSALRDGIARLEQLTGCGFGSARKPLTVSVRSGAKVSMPGMLETVLDVGLNELSAEGMIRATGNPRLAWDSYRRLIGIYAEVVAGLPPAPFETLAERVAAEEEEETARELDYAALRKLTRAAQEKYRDLSGAAFPQDPYAQLTAAATAVFRSWDAPKAIEYRRRNGIEDDAGTAVLVQAMVFGNAGPLSGSGVGFTRDPATGEDALYLEFQFDAQGEDVVGGRHLLDGTERLKSRLPKSWSQLGELRRELEALFHDVQDFEITVQEGRLYLLQTRRAKRTPWAAVRIAVDLVSAGRATPAQALATLDGIDLDAVGRSRITSSSGLPVGRGVVASLGVASGPIALDAEAARDYAGRGTPPILVRPETTTADFAAMHDAAGILTALGGRTAHAAVVARQLGKVCLVGCPDLKIDLDRRCCTIGGRHFNEGDVIGLDSNEGGIYAGALDVSIDRPVEAIAEIRRWQDGLRGRAL